MSFQSRKLLLSLVLLAAMVVSISAFTPAIPIVHAGVNTPALLIQPATQPLAAAGSTVTYNVNVANMSTFAGWDIYVRTNPNVLNPTGFTLGAFMPAGFESIHCVNLAGTSCDANDGPGVVHSGFASFGFAAGSGTLFTITYTAVAGPGTSVGLPEASTRNNGLNSLFDTSGANITGIPEISGTYGTLVNPTTTSVSCGTSPVVVGSAITCTATVTDTSATPSTPLGTVTFQTSGSGGFTGSPCNLAGTGATSTCSATYSPTAVGLGTHTITASYSGEATHAASSGTTSVTVRALLAADFTSSPAAPSVGQTVTFTSTVTGGATPYTYSWAFGDGGTSTLASPTHAYATAGAFTVTLTVTDSSSPVQTKTASHTVTIAAALAAAFTSSPANPIIAGTVTFTSTVTGGTTPYSYSWTFGDGATSTVASPTHAYATAGTFTVTLTVTDSSTPAQTKTASHTVTVAGPLSAAFTSSPAAPPIGQTVTFTSTVSGGTTPYTYSWTFGDGASSTVANPTHAYTTSGIFTVTLVVTDSSTPAQSTTVSHTVTVSTSLTADFTSSPAHPLIGGTVTFTSTVSGGLSPYTYSWTFGDGGTSTVAGPTHAYATAGTFTVTLTVTDASTPAQSRTATHTITVAAILAANFASSPASPGIGQTVTFTSTVSGGTIPYAYSWTFGDGATSTVANPTHAYATAGTFTVTLTVTDASTPIQTATASHTVTVASGLAADFTSSPAHPLIGGTVTFTSTVTGGTTPYTYGWTFGDAGTSTVANPTHAYATSGTFTVTLTVTDASTPAQSRTATHTVTVASALVADFTSSPAAPAVGQTVTFTSTVSGGTTPYTYSWTFGDGATSTVASPTHAYATAGTFTVALTVIDASTPAQSKTATHTVTVAGTLAADFTSSPAHPVIGGTVTFTSTVTGGRTPYVYSWTFGDAGTSNVASPTHAYTTAGTFTVTLTVTDASTPAQSSTASHTVTVAGTLSVNFTFSPTTPNTGQTVSFTSTISGGTAPFTYSWTFGDAGTSNVANPTHVYTTAGTFTVALTVTDFSTPTQTATASHTITVSTPPPVDFTITANPASIGPLVPGLNGTSVIIVRAVNGFTGTITLSKTASAGLNAFLNVTSVTLTATKTAGGALLSVNSAAAGNYGVTVTGTSGSLSHPATVSASVVDFTVGATPLTVGPLRPSQIGSSTITVNGLNGIITTVAVSRNPGGTTGGLSLASCALSATVTSCTGTLTVSSDVPGVYLVLVDATSNVAVSLGSSGTSTATVDHTVTVTVIVQDFAISASPSTIGPQSPGATGTSTITVTALQGFTGTVTLTTSPSSTHLTASVAPTSVTFTSGGPTTLTATLSVSFDQLGTYSVLVNGASTGYPTHSVRVHVVSPATVLVSPQTQGLAAPGSTVSYSVNVVSMPLFAGYDISVRTNNAVLSPNSIDTSATIIPGFFETVNCVNGGFYANGTAIPVGSSGNLNCGSTDGPGIAHSAGASISGFTAGDGILFTINYIAGKIFTITASPSSLGPLAPANASDGAGGTNAAPNATSTVNLSLLGFGTSVTVFNDVVMDPNGVAIAHNTQSANYGISSGTISLTLTSPAGLNAYISTTSITLSSTVTSGTATVTVNSNLVGNYNLVVTGTFGTLTSHSVTITVTVVDFNLNANPLTVGPLRPSQIGSSTITVTGLNGITTSVSVSRNPGGTTGGLTLSTCALSPTTTTCTGTLTVSSDVPGVYLVVVDATANFVQNNGNLGSTTVTVDHQVTVTVIVQDFAISASPTTIGPLSPGATGTSTITVTALQGFTGTVTFSTSPSSTHLTASVAPTSVTFTSGGPTTLTATLSVSFDQLGTYFVLVNGASTGYPTHSVRVHVISPATVLINPLTQGLAAPGATVSYSVNVVSMPTFAGYDISVRTNNAVLSPNSIDTSATIIPGFFETVNCVNGGFYANGTAIPVGSSGNLNCGSTDGPGIAHSAGASISGFTAGDGILFTINYIAGKIFTITANPTSLGPLVPANASDGAGGTNAAPNATSTVNLGILGFGTGVTVFNDVVMDPNGVAIAHNTQSASYGVSSGTVNLTLTPSTGLNAYISQTSFTASGTATVTVNSNFAGNYNLVVTGTFGTLTSHSVTITVTVVDFNVNANPLTVGPLRPNQIGSTTVTVTGLNGITTSVSVSRNPGGTSGTLTLSTCALSPTTTTCTGTMTVFSDVPGVYIVVVDATANVAVSGGNLGPSIITVDHQVVVTVTVQDFTISANPTTIGPQSPGATGTSMITVTALQGFTGTVTFTLSPSSTHLTATIAPTSVTFTSGGPTTLTATLSVSFDQLGTYAVLVTGSSTGYPSHSVRVHVISPATIVITPLTQGLAAPGSIVSYSVGVVSMSTFAGYDISVRTNNALLSPNTIDTSGSVIPGFFETVNCINGGFYANGTAIPLNAPGNLNCGPSDGPGIAHSAGSSTSGFVSGDGLLFTINYIAGAADFSISASPSTISNLGVGQTGTSTITITALTPSSTTLTIFNDVIFDTNGSPVAHNIQNANYGASFFDVFLSLTPSSGLTASITPASVRLSSTTPTGTATLSVSAIASGNYNVLVGGSATGLPNTASHSIIVNVQVTDFTVTASPSTIAPPQGVNSGTSTITVTGLNGFTGTVTLTLSASTGLTASISPTTIALSATVTSGTATLQVSATASGTYTVIITGSSPGFQSRTVRVTVIIISGADFRLSASPNLITTTNEDQDTFTSRITVTSIGSFAGTVCLTAVESPNGGLGPTLSPTCVTVTAGGTASSTLRFSVQTGETNPGTYTITVTGTSGSLTHTTTVTVQVPSSQVRISVSSLRTVSLSANGGVQKWTVTITNRAHSVEYVNVVISGSTSSGTHGFTESKSVTVGSRSTVTIVITHTFTAADVGQSFNYTAVGMFGTSPTNLNQVTFPKTGHFTVVA